MNHTSSGNRKFSLPVFLGSFFVLSAVAVFTLAGLGLFDEAGDYFENGREPVQLKGGVKNYLFLEMPSSQAATPIETSLTAAYTNGEPCNLTVHPTPRFSYSIWTAHGPLARKCVAAFSTKDSGPVILNLTGIHSGTAVYFEQNIYRERLVVTGVVLSILVLSAICGGKYHSSRASKRN